MFNCHVLEAASEISLHLEQEFSRDLPDLTKVPAPIRLEKLILVFNAFHHRLHDPFAVVHAADQIQRIQRDYEPLQGLA